MSSRQVYEWFKWIIDGGERFEIAERTGIHLTSLTDKNIELVLFTLR